MTDKHTPGPWFAVPYGDGHDTVICEDEAGNQRIAFMAIPGSRDEQSRRKKWAEIKANARLIAAAPDMATRITALEAREAELVERLSNASEELEYFVEFARRQSEFEGDADAGFAVVREARATLAKHHEGEG